MLSFVLGLHAGDAPAFGVDFALFAQAAPEPTLGLLCGLGLVGLFALRARARHSPPICSIGLGFFSSSPA